MPTTKEGTCPWCERHLQTLYLTMGMFENGQIWTQWVCAKCRNSVKKYRDFKEKAAQKA